MAERLVGSGQAGDIVLLSGTVFTGRDEVHKFLHKGGDLPALRDAVIYHCGPVVLEEGGRYRVVAAGPNSSGLPDIAARTIGCNLFSAPAR